MASTDLSSLTTKELMGIDKENLIKFIKEQSKDVSKAKLVQKKQDDHIMFLLRELNSYTLKDVIKLPGVYEDIDENHHPSDSEQMDIDELKQLLVKRGMGSFKDLGRTFLLYDVDDNKKLSFSEFANGLRHFGIPPNMCKTLFKRFDSDGNDSIELCEFFNVLRGSCYEGNRKEIVEKAFKKADITEDGVITADDLKGVYNIKDHPKFKSGDWTENDVLKEFFTFFDPKKKNNDDKVTKAEFLDFYAGVSAYIESDREFEEIMKKAWNI